MKTALIIGISGQDGSYLAEFLYTIGYKVIGTTRSIDNCNLYNISPVFRDINLEEWDLCDADKIFNIIENHKPAEIYNFAAFSSGSGMYDHPVEIAEVNGVAVTKILESIRQINSSIKFCQASSSELFGEAEISPQNESTRFNPRSPYGAAKLYAHSMISIYRKKYNLFACSAILFNHESPRRGLGFVTRKITHEVARIKYGLSNALQLGNLDAKRDWGFAGDYVKAMHLMLQSEKADDYVLATGVTHSVRDFCDIAFKFVGLNYMDYVQTNNQDFRQSEQVQLVGDISKITYELSWNPEVLFEDLVKMMVENDLDLVKKTL